MRVLPKMWVPGIWSFVLAPVLLAACTAEPETPEVTEAPQADSPVAEPAASGDASSAVPASTLTDRVWVQADSSELPGKMRIFLSNGTLLMDSCWETYRLAEWRRVDGDSIAWSEDEQEIRGEVLEQNDETLRLRLALIGGSEEQIYRAATVPYVCPDMVR